MWRTNVARFGRGKQLAGLGGSISRLAHVIKEMGVALPFRSHDPPERTSQARVRDDAWQF